jgi:hypothetical protein
MKSVRKIRRYDTRVGERKGEEEEKKEDRERK